MNKYENKIKILFKSTKDNVPRAQAVVQAAPSFRKRKHFTLLCEEDDEEPEPELSSNEIIIKELRLYTTLKGYITKHTCPLEFYKLNSHHLPILGKISQMLFCITASSVPSECLFSKSGELISNKRTRLNPELAEDLLMLKINRFD